MSSERSAPYFYQFLGTHSLLIGLLPFFLPVYLWTRGLGLAGFCLLIGTSGISFVLSLGAWQRWAVKWPLRRLITLTFVLEICLLACVGVVTTIPDILLYQTLSSTNSTSDIVLTSVFVGMLNGCYNAFFWTTQRTLFIQQLGANDAGKQYGNFQIFVTLFLKVGILTGGFLLENGGFVVLLAMSAGISAISNLWLYKARGAATVSYTHLTLPTTPYV